VRDRRVALGLTQQQLAELVGVTCQQASKYEKGVNRISAGRLLAVARALGVDVAHFYEGLGGASAVGQEPRSRKMLELARDFAAITGPRRREALSNLARVLAGGPPGGEDRR
jgi:transcriptional regulator with XRE-family HTH domain